MATNTTTSGSLLLYHEFNSTTHLRHSNHHNLHHKSTSSLFVPKPTSLCLSPLKFSLENPPKPYFLRPHFLQPLTFSSLNPSFPEPSSNSPQNPPQNPQFLLNSTKTLTTLFSLCLSLSSKITQIISSHFQELKTLFLTPSSHHLETLQFLQDNVFCTVGPLFLASVKNPSNGTLNTPLTVVASGMSKWLDIYSGVLMVRVLLSWFPNIPWDRQPLSAIRDLCDSYLNLFRNIIPPIFYTLDVSPLLAFAVLGTLGSILRGATGY